MYSAIKSEKEIHTELFQTNHYDYYSYCKNGQICFKNDESSLNLRDHKPRNSYSYYNNSSTFEYDFSSYRPFSPSDLNDSNVFIHNNNYYKNFYQHELNYYNPPMIDNCKKNSSNIGNSFSISSCDSSLKSSFDISACNSNLDLNYVSVFGIEKKENIINEHKTKKQSTPINPSDDLKWDQTTKDSNIRPRNILNELEVYYQSEENQSSSRRSRTAFTTQQRYYLLQIFEKSLYPSRQVLEEAAKSLNVSVKTLQTWFKNTRSKHKKLQNIKIL